MLIFSEDSGIRAKHLWTNESLIKTSSRFAEIGESFTKVIVFVVGLLHTGMLPKSISSPSILMAGTITFALTGIVIFLAPLPMIVTEESIKASFVQCNLMVTSII